MLLNIQVLTLNYKIGNISTGANTNGGGEWITGEC